MTKNEEYSKRMLAWFEDMRQRAEATLYKPIEPLTEQEEKRLGIIRQLPRLKSGLVKATPHQGCPQVKQLY